jgi:hypothetical protein
VTSIARVTGKSDYRGVQDSELAGAATRRARRWRHIAGAGLACTAVALEIVAIASTTTAACVPAFALPKVVAIFALALASVALLTLCGSVLEAAVPKGARIGDARRWDPRGVVIGLVGLAVSLPLFWYAVAHLQAALFCGLGF